MQVIGTPPSNRYPLPSLNPRQHKF
jgi:hypothetical protein